MEQVQSVYIHIPFCLKICHYCAFVKYFYHEKLADEYLIALEKEMDTKLKGEKNKVRTIYIGGGTPSALSAEQLHYLLKIISRKFDISACKEFTIEVNPGDIDDEKTALLKQYGISRISFGVQTMDDQLLEELGRRHRAKDVYRTVELLQKYHFTNISLDLMFALPHQTIAKFESTLDEVFRFQLPHYSIYGLQIEPKTLFYKQHERGVLHRPTEEEEIQMYSLLRNKMEQHRVKQYEISNFAVPGFESKHNLTYWSNDYYYGFGAGAHAYYPGKRAVNIHELREYIKKAMEDGKPIFQTETITIKEKLEEEMMLGLRKIAGINKHAFKEKFGFSLESVYSDQIKELTDRGLLAETENVIRLTDEGLLLANKVSEYFMLTDTDKLPAG